MLSCSVRKVRRHACTPRDRSCAVRSARSMLLLTAHVREHSPTLSRRRCASPSMVATRAADGPLRAVLSESRPDPRAHPRRGAVAAAPGGIRAATRRRTARRAGAETRRGRWRWIPATTRPAAVKAIEARINHDVKAVEYYVREKLAAAGAAPRRSSWCTSAAPRRTSTISATRACCARARDRAARRARASSIERAARLAHEHAALPMLARTHGQTASPTTLGKEFANVVARLRRARQRCERG